MKIITVNIQKGGCGKTSTAQNMGECIRRKGNKVLLVDLDPQGNLSFALGRESSSVTVYEVMKGEPISNAISKTDSCDIVPANILLCGAEQEFNRPGREYILKKALEEVKNDYDYVIIDTPPSLGVLSVNALTCADYAVIPLEPSAFAIQGLGQLWETIETVQEYCNKELKIAGVLLTKYNGRTTIDKRVTDILEKFHDMTGCNIFDTRIHCATAIKTAQDEQLSLEDYNAKSKALQDYKNFTDELLEDIKYGAN